VATIYYGKISHFKDFQLLLEGHQIKSKIENFLYDAR